MSAIFMSVEPVKVKEIFVDVTYNTSKMLNHLYAIISQELGYGVFFEFMLMIIYLKEDIKSKKHTKETLECNIYFYSILRELGIISQFVHVDKDFSEISASQIISFHMKSDWRIVLLEQS
jgi:hypothetical protein